MLTADKYTTGLAIAEQLKYNINYNKAPLFDVICANLASKLINQTYVELSDEEIEKLNKLINK